MIYEITRAKSKSTSGDAFASDTPDADTLIVDPGAFLISSNGNGANLAATFAWTVTVNGLIVSQNGVGIDLAAGNVAGSTITIGKLLEQSDFSEPLARINTHPIDTAALGWSEAVAWDNIAGYYRTRT
jgi:hypothetical protein